MSSPIYLTTALTFQTQIVMRLQLYQSFATANAPPFIATTPPALRSPKHNLVSVRI